LIFLKWRCGSRKGVSAAAILFKSGGMAVVGVLNGYDDLAFDSNIPLRLHGFAIRKRMPMLLSYWQVLRK
jgi:cellobiose phosphorylase